MFKCAVTHKVSKPHEKMIKVVVKVRPATYTNWKQIDGSCVEHTTHGTEIVREVGVTLEGYRILLNTLE